MNPPDWYSVQWPMQYFDRRKWAGTEKEIGKFTGNDNDPQSQNCHYRYHQKEQQRPTRKMEVGQHSIPSPSPSSCREPSADLRSDGTMTPDGPSVGVAEKDNELERKKKKLEEIQNRIIRTKAAIALKKILPYLKKTDELSDNPLDDKKDLVETCLTTTKEASLKDRVNCILQLKKSLGLPKTHSRDPTSSTKDDGAQQEDHPLKLRVKRLMNNKSRTIREAPNVPPHNMPPPEAVPVQSPSVPAGFQHLQHQNFPPTQSHSRLNPGFGVWHAVNDQRMQVNHLPPMNPSVPPRTATLNCTPAFPEQSSALPAGFQHFQIHNRTVGNSFGMCHAVDGPRTQLNHYPPMNPSVPPPTATLNRTPALPVQSPAVPAGFQHLQAQNQSWSKPESTPAYETWPTEEGQKMRMDPYPPMSPNERPQSPTQDPPSPGHEQRPGSPGGFQHVQSRSRRELSPAYDPRFGREQRRMQTAVYPPMSPNERPWTPSPDAPSPGPEQRPGSPAGFQQLKPHERSQTPSPDPPLPAPLQRPAIAQGMQRFLNVLNKGVDIDLFTSIINDDSQSIPSNAKPPLYKPPPNEPSKLENNWTEPPQNDSLPSQAEQRSRSQSGLGGSTELPTPEGSPEERNNPANDDLNHRGNRQFLLGSASSCPPVEEENPMQLQLQSILKTLGLSLDKEEMSGLTNRTKERLYGKRKDNGQEFHTTSGSEKPREPSPEICDGTSTSIPPQPRPATPQHPQENKSMECRKRRRRSPCSQSRDRSSRDSEQRESRGKDKRWDTDGCGDAGMDQTQDRDGSEDAETDKTRDRDPYRDSETDKRQDGHRTHDSGTDKRQVGDSSEYAETDQTQDGDPSGESGTEKRQQRDHHRDADKDKRWDRDRHSDAETDKGWDREWHREAETDRKRDRDHIDDSETDQWRHRDRHRNSETYMRRDRDRSGDSETDQWYQRDHHRDSETDQWHQRDRHRDSETDQLHQRDRHRDSETYNRQDRDPHKDSETYKRWERDHTDDSETDQWRHRHRHRDSETYKWRHRDRHRDGDIGKRRDRVSSGDSENDKVKISSSSPEASLENPDTNSALALPGNTSTEHFQNTTYHGSANNDSSPLNSLGAATPYPHLSTCPEAQNPSYPLPDTMSSPATSTPQSLHSDGLHLDYLFNPDLSKSEGQHWSSQRCLQVINLLPRGKKRCLTTLINNSLPSHNNPKMTKRINKLQLRFNSMVKTEAKPALPQAAAQAATLPQRQEEVTVQKQEVVAFQKEPTEGEMKATLKEKLQAFNQKMKQSPFMPASVSSCTYSDLT